MLNDKKSNLIQVTTVSVVDLSAQDISSEVNGQKQNRSMHQFLFSQRPSMRTLHIHLRPTPLISDTRGGNHCQAIAGRLCE